MNADDLRGRGLLLPVTAEERSRWQRRLNGMAVLRHMGAELDLSLPTVVRLTLGQQLEAHAGGLGTTALNGAVIAGMIDCGIATAGILQFRGRTCGTVHLSMDFMKPVRAAHPTLECCVVRRTEALAFVEAWIAGPDGRSHVRASGIVSLARLSGSRTAAEDQSEHWNWLATEAVPAMLHRPEHADPVLSTPCPREGLP